MSSSMHLSWNPFFHTLLVKVSFFPFPEGRKNILAILTKTESVVFVGSKDGFQDSCYKTSFQHPKGSLLWHLVYTNK